MKDNLSIIITMLIFVILIVIFPLYNYFERQDDMSYNLALKATTNFVDEVLESGYITQEMYSKYVSDLSNTGNIYDIQLEAHRKVLTKETNEEYNEQYLIDYNDDIFKPNDKATSIMDANILKEEAYRLNEGDQFYVKTKNSNTTMAGAIFNTIVPTSSKDRIVVNYGGIVKKQSWAKVDAKYYDAASIVSNAPSVYIDSVNGIEAKDKNIYSGTINLYPNNGDYVTNINFTASGPENKKSWWNKISKYVWTIDNQPSKEQNLSEKFIISSLKTGEHTLRVYAIDETGNKTNETTVKIVVEESKKGGTGGKEFNGDSFDIPIPKFINAYPKKIVLEVYLGTGHGAYKQDNFRLYNSSKKYIEKKVGSLNTTTTVSIASNQSINIESKYNMTSGKFDKIQSGNITFTNKSARLIKITLDFNYEKVKKGSNINIFDDLRIYYKNNCGASCYLNTVDDNNVKRNGVYNYVIEYTSI